MAIFTIGFNPAVDRILECPDFHLGGHQQARQVARLAAGKAANVSRALALLGADSIATGFVGTEELEFFHSQLMSCGPGRVLCRYIEVGGKTRENISVLDPTRKLETHLRDVGFDVTPDEAELLMRKIVHEVRMGDVVVFSGSLCGGVGCEYYLGLVDRCLAAGAKVAVDSSGEPLKLLATKQLWLLKPNLEELRTVVGRDVPDETKALWDAGKELLPHVAHVVISRGAAGAVLVTAQGAWSAVVETGGRQAVRTVACGDHLLAGFVAEMSAGRSAEAALKKAVAVGTARAFSEDMEGFSEEAVETAMNATRVEQIG